MIEGRKGIDMGAAVALVLPRRKDNADAISGDLDKYTYYVEE